MKQFNESIRGKLFGYFKSRLNIKPSTKGWWRGNCIWCGGTNTMGIHPEHSKAHCFKCLDSKPSIEVLMDIEGFATTNEAHKFLQIQQEYEYFEAYTRVQKREIKPVELPESFTLLSQGTNMYARSARAYMKGRGFSINRLSLKGVGFCTDGPYAGYIIFPFYTKGTLVYFQGRRFLPIGPKMKNPNVEDFGIGKEQIIYNQDALYMYNRCYVVESITNAETLGDSAVATLGKSISSYQLYHMIGSPCDRFIFILDPDAIKEALISAMQLVNYKKTKVIQIPYADKDVNDIGKVKTLEFVKRTPYQTYNELFRLKLNVNGTQGPIFTRTPGPYRIDRRGC
jgi:hypothetical protein